MTVQLPEGSRTQRSETSTRADNIRESNHDPSENPGVIANIGLYDRHHPCRLTSGLQNPQSLPDDASPYIHTPHSSRSLFTVPPDGIRQSAQRVAMTGPERTQDLMSAGNFWIFSKRSY